MQQLFAMSVDKDLADTVLVLLQGYYQYLVCALLLIIGGPVLCSRTKQRYIPGVPIVGIEEPGGIKQARENFCTDAKLILAEGYQKACRRLASMPRISLAKQTTVQKPESLLCPEPTWRAPHDPDEVCRGAQERAGQRRGSRIYYLRG